MSTLKVASSRLKNVLLLLFFLFVVFAIIAIQMFKGLLRQQCFSDDFRGQSEDLWIDNTSNWEPQEYFCQLEPSTTGNNDTAYNNCPDHLPWCLDIAPNPNAGVTSFDNIGAALLNVFVSITLEGWADIQYKLLDTDPPICQAYFILLTFTVGFFAANLCLAIIESVYRGKMEEEEQELNSPERVCEKLEKQGNGEEPCGKCAICKLRESERRTEETWERQKTTKVVVISADPALHEKSLNMTTQNGDHSIHYPLNGDVHAVNGDNHTSPRHADHVQNGVPLASSNPTISNGQHSGSSHAEIQSPPRSPQSVQSMASRSVPLHSPSMINPMHPHSTSTISDQYSRAKSYRMSFENPNGRESAFFVMSMPSNEDFLSKSTSNGIARSQSAKTSKAIKSLKALKSSKSEDGIRTADSHKSNAQSAKRSQSPQTSPPHGMSNSISNQSNAATKIPDESQQSQQETPDSVPPEMSPEMSPDPSPGLPPGPSPDPSPAPSRSQTPRSSSKSTLLSRRRASKRGRTQQPLGPGNQVFIHRFRTNTVPKSPLTNAEITTQLLRSITAGTVHPDYDDVHSSYSSLPGVNMGISHRFLPHSRTVTPMSAEKLAQNESVFAFPNEREAGAAVTTTNGSNGTTNGHLAKPDTNGHIPGANGAGTAGATNTTPDTAGTSSPSLHDGNGLSQSHSAEIQMEPLNNISPRSLEFSGSAPEQTPRGSVASLKASPGSIVATQQNSAVEQRRLKFQNSKRKSSASNKSNFNKSFSGNKRQTRKQLKKLKVKYKASHQTENFATALVRISGHVTAEHKDACNRDLKVIQDTAKLEPNRSNSKNRELVDDITFGDIPAKHSEAAHDEEQDRDKNPDKIINPVVRRRAMKAEEQRRDNEILAWYAILSANDDPAWKEWMDKWSDSAVC